MFTYIRWTPFFDICKYTQCKDGSRYIRGIPISLTLFALPFLLSLLLLAKLFLSLSPSLSSAFNFVRMMGGGTDLIPLLAPVVDVKDVSARAWRRRIRVSSRSSMVYTFRMIVNVRMSQQEEVANGSRLCIPRS